MSTSFTDPATIELRLIHDGKHWVAGGASLSARAQTLPELDQEVARLLKQKSCHRAKGSEVTVRMTFDRSVIPQWIRQYSGHYFNRVVKINIP